MKLKTLLLLLLSCPLFLSAAVKINISGQTAVLENGIILTGGASNEKYLVVMAKK